MACRLTINPQLSTINRPQSINFAPVLAAASNEWLLSPLSLGLGNPPSQRRRKRRRGGGSLLKQKKDF
jgi:hypothetical protein